MLCLPPPPVSLRDGTSGTQQRRDAVRQSARRSATEGPPQGVGWVSAMSVTVTCRSALSHVGRCLPHRLCPTWNTGSKHTCAAGRWPTTESISHILPCTMHTHISGPNFKEKNLLFQFNYLFIYI